MILAELEAFYSRPVAPTRRVALGDMTLPADPAPGFGGILLGGIIARFAPALDVDLHDDLVVLMGELSRRSRVSQPRLRYRLQSDRVGLQRCRHRLEGDGEHLAFRFDADVGKPAQHVLCALYAAAAIDDATARFAVMATLRAGLSWGGRIDDSLIRHLTGHSVITTVDALSNLIGWAFRTLGLIAPPGADSEFGPEPPSRNEIKAAFRDQLRLAHPDHGGSVDDAAQRIVELTEARRILLDA